MEPRHPAEPHQVPVRCAGAPLMSLPVAAPSRRPRCLFRSWRTSSDAIFVGEPTSSRGTHYGDSYRFVLPNSHVTFRVSSLYWQLSDPRDDRPWIPVAIVAPLTFQDYAAGA